MKSFCFAAVFFLAGFGSIQVNPGYGVVTREMGIGVYVCAVPARDFDTVKVFTTKRDFNSYAGPSIPQYIEGIQKPVDDLARKAINYAKRKKKKVKEINAIITRDGKTACAVHFKSEVAASMTNKAKPDEYKGYFLFIQNKPSKKYTKVANVKINNKLTLEHEAISSLPVLLDSLIKKYEKIPVSNNLRANAIISSSCVEAEFIKLEE